MRKRRKLKSFDGLLKLPDYILIKATGSRQMNDIDDIASERRFRASIHD